MLASADESGQVKLWDTRKCERPFGNWTAHTENIHSIDWHPEVRLEFLFLVLNLIFLTKLLFQLANWLATASGDKLVKVWNLNVADGNREPDTVIATPSQVGKVKWRPGKKAQLAR